MRVPGRSGPSFVLAATVSIAALAAFACNDPARPPEDAAAAAARAGIPSSAPYIRGRVTAATVEGGATLAEATGSVRVETDPSKTSDSPKAVASWSGATTRILRRDGTTVTPDELVRGVTVSVWITGPVLESYPAQVRAVVIVVE